MIPLFPYSDAHQLNLDWIIDRIKELWENAVFSVEGHSAVDGDVTIPEMVKQVEGNDPDSLGHVWIPQMVKSVNNTLPDSFGNVNLPAAAGVNSVDYIGPDGSGNVAPIISATKIFANKKILIIGDSISNTAQNWTTYFANALAPYNITLYNASKNGDSFAGQMSDNYDQVGSNYDIVILFLGVNDWQGNWSWEAGGTNSIVDATTGMISAIQANNPNARYIFVSPIPNTVSESGKDVPLLVYTGYFQKKFSEAGFQIIAGDTIPDFNPANTADLSDGLHPTAQGSEKISNFLLNAIITEQSTFSPVKCTSRTYEVKSGGVTIGYCDIILDASGRCEIQMFANGINAPTGVSDILQLPDIYATALLSGVNMPDVYQMANYFNLNSATHKITYYNADANPVANISAMDTTFVLYAFRSV